VIKLDLLEVIQESFMNKQMLKSMNATFLSLIPKKDGANSLDLLGPLPYVMWSTRLLLS